MTELPWLAEPVNAELHWTPDQAGYLDEGYLHFIGPDGRRAVVPVTRGPSTEQNGRPVWHVDIDGDVATVSPSIHHVGAWHSPNPARFRLVNALAWS